MGDWWDSDGDDADNDPLRQLPKKTAVSSDDDLFEFSETTVLGELEEKDLPPLAEGMQDCSGDRGVLLKKLKSAAGGSSSSASMKPSKENPFVDLHFKGWVVLPDGTNGEMFDQSMEYSMVVQLDFPSAGKSSLIKGLELALRSVSAGETAEVTVKAPYAYGKEGCAPNIPPDTDLRFEIEILDIRATQKPSDEVEVNRLEAEKERDRLETVRREREIASARRQEKQAAQANSAKPDRIAALREKLAQKNSGGGKKGKKGGKKK